VVVVVDADGVVLGTVRPEGMAGDARVLDVLQPAPPTVRPAITIDELAATMEKDGQHHVIVSTLDGKLLGIVERQDLDVDR
jgi:CBS domain-containing protein